MPFERPTLRQLVSRFRADIRTHTEGGDALLRRSVETVLSRVVPGLTHGLHGHLAWVVRQLLPDTCEPAGVQRWARLLGLTLRPATYAEGVITFAVTGTPTIPADTLIQRADGVRYLVAIEVTADAATVDVDVTAEEPGALANAAEDTPVFLVSPIAGVQTEGVVATAGIHDGTDLEDVEVSLRARVVARLGSPQRAGGPGDYVAWALEVAGVTRAWETPRAGGAGTVGVQFATDGDVSPIPSGPKVDEVQAYLAARAPVTIGRSIDGEWVGVITTAPVAYEIDPEIQLLPDTTEVREAVAAELVDLLRREGAPGVRIPLSRFDEAISSAAGETEHVLVSPTVDIEPAAGELPVLGTPVWS